MQSNLPNRKPTRLNHHNYSRPGAYFITICTKHKACILSTIVGDGALDVPITKLTPVGAIIEKYIFSTNRISNVEIKKYVIMPNHIHMIVIVHPPINKEYGFFDADGTSRAPSPTNDTIPRVISTFKRFCNLEIGENIFQRSYHDHIIRNQKDYENIWNYIEFNPTHWKKDCFYVVE